MAQAKVINIEDAKLKTLSVEIKAMTVNGKQMTLSTFRQLPSKNIFVDDYRLDGVPWGLVRYFWEHQDKNWFHVVWQKGNDLFRCHPFDDGLRNFVACPEQSAYEAASQASTKMRYSCNSKSYDDAMRNAYKLLQERHIAEVRKLEILPQLFIAV